MLRVAIAGEFQDGKSTLINALCGCDCAKTGYGIATTSEVQEYNIPGTNILLLDTPGFNSRRAEDSEQARAGIAQADACMYMLINEFTSNRFKDMAKALQMPNGLYKPFIPFINDHGYANKEIASESIAVMEDCGLHPILFGNEVPVIHALKWRKGKVREHVHQLGMRRLLYLLGVEPRQRVSPLEKICCLHKKLRSCFTFGEM